jgi:hypothetical protein
MQQTRRQFQLRCASSNHHNPATAVNVTMMYAPRATHDFHCGRSRIFKKRLGCDKSLMSRMTVMSMKTIAVKPVARKVAESNVKQIEHRAETQQHEQSARDAFGDEVRRQFPMPVDLVLGVVGSLHHVLGNASADLNGTVERLVPCSLGVRIGVPDFDGTFWSRYGGTCNRLPPPTRPALDSTGSSYAALFCSVILSAHMYESWLGGRRMQRPVVAVDVEQFGTRPLLGLANGHLRSGQLSAYFRSGVVQDRQPGWHVRGRPRRRRVRVPHPNDARRR